MPNFSHKEVKDAITMPLKRNYHHSSSSILLLSIAFVTKISNDDILGLSRVFVDSFSVARRPNVSYNSNEFGASRSWYLFGGLSDEREEFIDGFHSNRTSTESNSTVTTTTGYRRIEEWHEETRDSKHVIRHLKQEKTRWKKTFDNLS